MKNMKIILSLMLVFCLSVTSFAARPPHHRNHHHNPPPPHHHHSSYHHSSYDARDAVLVLLGITAITAVAVAASKSAKEKKQQRQEEEEEIQEQYEQVAQDLTLSQEQQEKVKQLFDTNRAKVAPIRDEKTLKTIELEQEKAKENPDENVINNLENEISNLSMQIYRITQDTKTELQTILTPAQYEAMENIQL